MTNNREDFGTFGRGVDKRGRTYYFLKNTKGGFGVTPITKVKFDQLMKKKISDDAKEAKRVEAALAKAKIASKKKEERESKKIAQQEAKRIAEVQKLAEKLRAEAKKKKEEAGIKPKLSEKQQHLARLNELYVGLAKDAAHVSEQYVELMDNYNRLSQDKQYKVVSGRLLKLSIEYKKLDQDIDVVLTTIKRAKEFNIKYQEQINGFLKRIETLDLRHTALLVEVEKTVERVEKERAARDVIANDKRKNIAAREQAKAQTKAARDKAKADKQKAKDDKRKSLTRKRRLEAVAKGRAQQKAERRAARVALVQEGRARQEEERIRLEQLRGEKQNELLVRQSNLAKFFDPSRSSTLAIAGMVGGFGGKILGGIGNTLGLDFSSEGKFLSGLFNGAKAFGRFGMNGIHSLTQRTMGLDDDSIQNQIDNPVSSNKKIKTPIQKSPPAKPVSRNQNNSAGSKLFSIREGLKAITNKTSNVFSNAKSFFGGDKNSSNVSNNNINSIRNDKFQNTDFNRTDDNVDEELVSPIVELLEKILKEIQKGNNPVKAGMFGGVGKVGLYGAAALGATALGVEIKKGFEEFISDKNAVKEVTSNSSSNVREVLIKKLKDKNASQDDIEEMERLIEQEKSARLYNDEQELKGIIQERNELLSKYSSNNLSSKISTIGNNSFSNSTNFRKDTSNSVIRSEVAKIEKVRELKDDPDGRLERLQKWLSDVFIPKLADSISNSMVTKKGPGKSFMPPVEPF